MKNISIHAFMHVPFEGLGCIESWITKHNYSLSFTLFYEKHTLPKLNDIDWLIIMGGPMGVYDEKKYPWIVEEKKFIREAIHLSKTIIGVCLGSQLIAEVLGAKVYPNKHKEIGWFNIEQSDKNQLITVEMENSFPVFHWHGDTFDLPTDSKRLFHSSVTKNQAFIYKKNVLGLQFHLEVTTESMEAMIKYGKAELIKNETIQSAEEIIKQTDFIEANNLKMFSILNYLEKIND